MDHSSLFSHILYTQTTYLLTQDNPYFQTQSQHNSSMSLDHTSHHEMQEILYTVIKLFLLHEQMKKHERNWFFGQHNFSYVFLVLAMQSSVQSWTSYRRCSCCLISSLCDLSCVKDCIDSCLKDPVFF